MSTDERSSPATTSDVPRQEGGVISASLRIGGDSLFLQPTIDRAPGVVVEPAEWIRTDAGHQFVYLDVQGSTFEEFETALLLDRTVRNPLLLEGGSSRCWYRVERADGATTIRETVASVDARLQSYQSRDGTWTATIRFPGRDALVAFTTRARERDLSVRVSSLQTVTGPAEGTTPLGLTPSQRELLTVAFEAGYFDVPRGISQEDLAVRFDVSKSAISQQLRRATAELCRSTIQ